MQQPMLYNYRNILQDSHVQSLFIKVKPQGRLHIHHIGQFGLFFPVKQKYSAHITFTIEVNTGNGFIRFNKKKIPVC